jgi:hypothetical protein
MKALEGEKIIPQIVVHYGNGVTAPLPISLDYGQQDWDDPIMGVREFVSNALDAALAQGLGTNSVRVERYDTVPKGEAGCTRVFIPLRDTVADFLNHLGDYFLHFWRVGGEKVNLIPHKEGEDRPARIYRRGVFVREIQSNSSAMASKALFDYNLHDVQIDEARKLNDYSVRKECAHTLTQYGEASDLARVLREFICGRSCWEGEYQHWDLRDHSGINTFGKWKEAIALVLPANHVFSPLELAPYVIDAGFHPIITPQGWYEVLRIRAYNKTADGVLDDNAKEGRKLIAATPAMHNAVNWAYNIIAAFDALAEYRKCPTVAAFTEPRQGEKIRLGFYDHSEKKVYFNHEVYGQLPEPNRGMLTTALHELAHHCSGASDNTREFEDWLIRLIVNIAR